MLNVHFCWLNVDNLLFFLVNWFGLTHTCSKLYLRCVTALTLTIMILKNFFLIVSCKIYPFFSLFIVTRIIHLLFQCHGRMLCKYELRHIIACCHQLSSINSYYQPWRYTVAYQTYMYIRPVTMNLYHITFDIKAHTMIIIK